MQSGKSAGATLNRVERVARRPGWAAGRGGEPSGSCPIPSVRAGRGSRRAIPFAPRASKAGLAGAVKIERQTATLRAVYRGTDTEAVQLRNDVLALAAAEGRSADEAVGAAVLLGAARADATRGATEAVRVLLVAANSRSPAPERGEPSRPSTRLTTSRVRDLPRV